MGMMALMGMAIQAGAAVGGGISAKRAADLEAQQLEVAGGQAQAAAQRQAHEELRKGRLLQSRALAVAAASGGGASDPTVLDIIGDIAAEGEYRSELALYEGADRAHAFNVKGEASRAEGRARRNAGYVQAASSVANYYGKQEVGKSKTLMASGTSMFDKYGRGGYNWELDEVG